MPEYTKEELVDLALKTADIVDHGWCRGTNENLMGSVCAVGALSKAIYGDPSKIGLTSAWDGGVLNKDAALIFEAVKVIKARENMVDKFEGLVYSPSLILTLINYNDYSATQDDVVDLWRTVAKNIANS